MNAQTSARAAESDAQRRSRGSKGNGEAERKENGRGEQERKRIEAALYKRERQRRIAWTPIVASRKESNVSKIDNVIWSRVKSEPDQLRSPRGSSEPWTSSRSPRYVTERRMARQPNLAPSL